MSTQNPTVTDVTTYDIRISEQQRKVLRAALQTYISATPDGGEHDEFGTHVAGSLEDMLDVDGRSGPLYTIGINSFVL